MARRRQVETNASRSCATTIRYHDERYYGQTRPRSPTPSTTTSCASCASSRRSTPSSSPTTRRRSGRARRRSPHRSRRSATSSRCCRSTTRSRAEDLVGVGRAARPHRDRGHHLRRRAQARRPRDLAALRGRPARPRRHPRQRRDRRGRDRQRGHDRRPPPEAQGPQGPRRARGAGRGLHVARRVRRAQPPAGREGRPALRQPAQRRGGLAAPDRRVASPRAATSRCSATSRAWSRAARSSVAPRDARLAARARVPGEPADRAARRRRGGARVLRCGWRSSATRSATRSTARW